MLGGLGGAELVLHVDPRLVFVYQSVETRLVRQDAFRKCKVLTAPPTVGLKNPTA